MDGDLTAAAAARARAKAFALGPTAPCRVAADRARASARACWGELVSTLA
jgi:hypothetical protein